MIKISAIILLVVNTLLFFGLKFYWGDQLALSFLFSSALLLVNYVVLAMMWRAVLIYKKTALVTLVALIKYPLIGFSIFWAGQQSWLDTRGIVIGICAFLIIIVVSVLTFKSKKITDK